MVIPQTHDEHHGRSNALAELGHAALLLKVVAVVEGDLLRAAEVCRDAVARVALDGALRVGDDLAALHVEALDLGQLAVVALEELRDHRHLLGRVDRLARAVEFLVALAVRVEVAAVGIAAARVPGFRVCPTASVPFATVLAGRLTRVGRVGGRDGVRLPVFWLEGRFGLERADRAQHSPDIHLRAARAVLADAGVLVVGRLLPVANVGLAVDELEVTGALGIAVTCTVLGARLVARVLGQATVLVHGDEVQGAVEATPGRALA